ncbi:MAG: CBS domain-containing protein [Planctomycetes bacterium]|nr:CBS domain-containing protein [Planctomycetota bacterium]
MATAQLSMFVTYNPATLSADASLEDAIQLLTCTGFHHLPVVDQNQRIVGMLSDLDVVRAVEETNSVKIAVGPSSTNDWRRREIGELMTHHVIAISHDESTDRALIQMLQHRIHSLPVVENGCLIGIITTTDFVREFSHGDTAISREKVNEHMIAAVEEINIDASLDEAYQQMRLSAVDYLCALEGNFPLGIVSNRDVRDAKCRQTTSRFLDVYESSDYPDSLRKLIANTPVVRPGHRLSEAAALMHETSLQAVAVMNHAHRLLGVVTEDLLLSLMADFNS